MDLNGNHLELYLMQNYAVLLQDWISNKVIHCNKEMPEQIKCMEEESCR